MKDDYTTNSHYLTHTFLLECWENVLFELGSERVRAVKIGAGGYQLTTAKYSPLRENNTRQIAKSMWSGSNSNCILNQNNHVLEQCTNDPLGCIAVGWWAEELVGCGVGDSSPIRPGVAGGQVTQNSLR